jgi:DNA-binding CsgD family transcriptional regulator
VADVLCVGRELERARLRRHLESAQHGSGGLVVIEGAAGVGKTTLAVWCMHDAIRSGGSAHEVGALGPERELPAGMWARLSASIELGRSAAPSVLLDGGIEPLHPHERYAAVLALLHDLGPPPVVLVLDDLHNADESSLTLLAQLGPALPSTGVLVVGTSRGAAAHPTPGGRDALESLEPWSHAMTLGQLDPAGVRALALATAGPTATAWVGAVHAVLVERSGGNPLVLRTILDDLGVADGARPSGTELAALPVDAAVGDVLARRLSTLPPASIELLHAAALIGGDVRPDVLGDVLQRDVTVDVERVIAAGALAALPDGRLRFVHPAVSEAVVARTPTGVAELHVRIADWLRRRGRGHDRPAIAHHLAAAGELVSADELAAAAMDAAEQALRGGDHAAAARAFDLALSSGADVDRVDLLLRSSSAHHGAGHRAEGWERARHAADLCRSDRPVEMAHAALSYARGRDYRADIGGPVELLRRALAVLPHDHPLRIEVLASLSMIELSLPVPVEPNPFPGADDGLSDAGATIAWHWITRPDIARPLADEALRLARATGDEQLVARVAMAWRQAHCAPERLGDRLAATEHAIAHARSAHDRVLSSISAVLDHLEAGARIRVDLALAELASLGAATGDPAVRWRTSHLAAMVEFASGRPDSAERASSEAFSHGVQASENGRWVVRGVQAAMLSLEVDDDPRPTLDFFVANVDELAYPPMRAGVVCAFAEGGRRDEAMRHLGDLVAHLLEDPGREASWLLTAGFTADAIASVSDAALASKLAPVADPFAERIILDGLGIHCHGCLARPLARMAHLMGDRDRAYELFALARARDDAAGLHRFVLMGDIDELTARALDGSIGEDERHERAAVVEERAASMGLRRTARRAGALRQPGGVAHLSERQYAVLMALAEGLTYQAAGERLGFSHSTIRHEAMRVYAALGAADRDAAVQLARARGLLPQFPTGEGASHSGDAPEGSA